MKKNIDIYFILYLGLLMAFFGLDSEVVEYQEKQEIMLAQAVIGRLDNLVQLGEYDRIPNDDSIIFFIPLKGDFNPENFLGDLFFKNQDETKPSPKTVLVQSDDAPNIFTASISKEDFDNKKNAHRVSIVYETTPFINDSTKNKLIEEYGKELAEKMVLAMEKIPLVQNELDMALLLIPDEEGPKTVFSINPKNVGEDNSVNGIVGSKAKISFIVTGIKKNSDYEILFNGNDKNNFGISIKKDKQVGLMHLIINRFKKGNVKISAKLKGDGSITSSPMLRFNVKKPEWKKMNPKEIYVGDPFDFDGTLKGIDGPADKARYSFEISGSPFPKVLKENGWPTFSLPGSNFKSPGRFAVQLLLDGNKISNMKYEVTVKKIPEPIITFKTKGNNVTVTATAYGSKNKVKKMYFNGGIKAGSATRSQEEFDGHRHSITRNATLNCDGSGFAEVDVEITYSYGDRKNTKAQKILCGN